MHRQTKAYAQLCRQTAENLRTLADLMDEGKVSPAALTAATAPMMPATTPVTGSDLKRVMRREHISLRMLAGKIDVSLGAIRYWLKQGKHPIPSKHYPALQKIMTPAETKQSKSA